MSPRVQKIMKRKKEPIIYPDEIFMDAQNIPGFETGRFEGRIEKSISKRSFWGMAFFSGLVMLLFFIKIFSLQVARGEEFALRGENNRLRAIPILPNRGIIYGKGGEKLAWNGQDARFYSEMPGLSHILGYMGLPSKRDFRSGGKIAPNAPLGKDAIEKKYESVLAGVPGMKLIETDSRNKVVSESAQRLPIKGKDINLAVDPELQSRFFEIIESVAKERGFRGGAGIIIDINNGEVLSLASYPEFDSQILSNGKPKEKINDFIFNENNPFLNRAVSGLYAPGSIIKPFMALAALNEGVISPEKQIYSSGSISLPNPYSPGERSIFNDWKAHGFVDMRRALAVSSNVYFYEIGGGFEDQKGLGIQKIADYAKKFGLGSKTGIDLNGEQKGLVPSPEWKKNNFKGSIWRIGDTYNASIGQGFFQVTPIQMAVYAAAVANGGKILRPRLVRAPVQNKRVIVRELDIPKSYFRVVREGMRMAVLEGTASALNMPNIKIAAKTGTAEVGAAKKLVNSWIIGFFPYEKPRYAFSVVLEKGPYKNMVGALYAVRQILEWMGVNTPEYLNPKR